MKNQESSVEREQRNLAVAAGAAACCIWAAAVVVVERLADAFGALSAAGLEALIGGCLLLAIVERRGRRLSLLEHPCSYYCTAGAAWVLHQTFLFVAVGCSEAPVELMMVGLINYLWPIMTVLCSIPLLGKRFSGSLWLGLLLALAGIVGAKIAFSDLSAAGAAAALGAAPAAYGSAFMGALAWALYSNCVKRYACPQAESALPLFMLASALPLIGLGRILGEPAEFDRSGILLLISWSVLTTVAVAAWDLGIRNGGVVQLAVCSMFIPIGSTAITCVSRGVPITPPVLLAAAALTAGAWICNRSEISQRAAGAPSAERQAASAKTVCSAAPLTATSICRATSD